MRPRLTYANVMATVAVFISLGGASYALIRIPPNSVGTAQLKQHSVGSLQLKNGAVGSDQLQRESVRVDKLAAASVGSIQLQPDSVTSDQLAPGSVTAREVEPGSLLFSDFSQGEVAPANEFANVFASGGLDQGQVQGVTSSSRIGTGDYLVNFSRPTSDCVSIAAPGNTFIGNPDPGAVAYTILNSSDVASGTIEVRTFVGTTPANEPFNIVLTCDH